MKKYNLTYLEKQEQKRQEAAKRPGADCHECKGSGFVDVGHKVFKCSNCNGFGEVFDD